MTIARSTDHATRLHVADDGVVWQAPAGTMPSCSRLRVAEFFSGTTDNYFRVLGTAQNAELLIGLYDRGHKVEVAGPQICETANELHDPSIALYRAAQVVFSASLGGWHRFTAADYPSYKLAVCPSRHAGLLDAHPAMKRLSFIRGLNRDALAELCGWILDPRWFVDRDRPDRLSRLFAFLGLTAEYFVGRRATKDCVKTGRARRVLATWAGQSPAGQELSSPGNFLWRRWLKHSPEMANLRTSKIFVSYLVRAWQQGLAEAGGSHRAVIDPLFDPRRFLDTPEDLAAYRDCVGVEF